MNINLETVTSLGKPLTKEEVCDIIEHWELVDEESIIDRDPFPDEWPIELKEAWDELTGGIAFFEFYDTYFENVADDEGGDYPNPIVDKLSTAIVKAGYDIVGAMIAYLRSSWEHDAPTENEISFIKKLKEQGYLTYEEK